MEEKGRNINSKATDNKEDDNKKLENPSPPTKERGNGQMKKRA
jgi:hypothetical protein